MKARRRLVLFLGLVLFLPSLVLGKDLNLPDPSYEGYVYDGAGVVSEQAKTTIIQKAKGLDQKTGAQIVVAIIPSLDGVPIEEYSEALFQKWKIGNKEDQGVLLLVSMEEHKIRIETGYGLEGILPDMVCAQIIDGMAPYFRDNDLDQGLLYGFKEIFNRTAQEVGYEDTGEEIQVDDRAQEDTSLDIGSIIKLIVIIIVLTSLFSGPRGPRGRRRRRPGGFWIFPGGGFGGYSGGGFSGGGSGGFSGGGGWSGGGGSSGGGGASGGW